MGNVIWPPTHTFLNTLLGLHTGKVKSPVDAVALKKAKKSGGKGTKGVAGLAQYTQTHKHGFEQSQLDKNNSAMDHPN